MDRNAAAALASKALLLSLSARRAWIEIAGQPAHGLPSMVALRKESVDRNSWAARARVAQYWSLSARRAWIEIIRGEMFEYAKKRRSPQGERG